MKKLKTQFADFHIIFLFATVFAFTVIKTWIVKGRIRLARIYTSIESTKRRHGMMLERDERVSFTSGLTKVLGPLVVGKKIGGVRYEACSCGRSSPDSLGF